MRYLWVGLGGALGSIARYLVGLLVYERMGTRFPYGTFVINVSGCFVIGLVLAVLDERMGLSPAWREALAIGFVGAFTTFSTFEYETLRAVQHGQAATALTYVVSSLVLGFMAVWAGATVGKVLA
jgi:fluoride exporter